MSRSQTTALYTRVDNSFSNPVVGTVISPSDADTFFDDVEASMNAFIATSASSVAIGTGAKTFTVASDIANKVFIAGTFVHIYSRADTADYMFGSVTSYSTSTGELVTDITATGGSGTNTDWNIYQAGARGATGATGATGAVGATSGILQAYSNTTTDGDPGAGIFRLNNATPASATEAYLDNVDDGGATVSTIFDLFDDSTTTTKGHLRFEKSGDPTVWAQFAVTGSVVDGTGYRKITLGSGAGSGAFTDTDLFAITFFRSGDKGADGAGVGDVVGPASSVDAEVALFDLTTGKLLKSATTTGIAKLTSGVLSAASDGTDYLSSTTGAKQGKQTIWMPARAMWPRTTNGPAAVSRELTTGGDTMITAWGFDTTTEEGVQFYLGMPKSWDKSTLTFSAVWTNASGLTTETVSWGLSVGAFTDSDAIDTTDLGTEVRVSDTWLAQNDLHVTAESSAVTVGNTPIDDDLLIGQIVRSVSNDNMTGDAELLGVKIHYTTNAATDT